MRNAQSVSILLDGNARHLKIQALADITVWDVKHMTSGRIVGIVLDRILISSLFS